MNIADETIVNCPDCGVPMDVSQLAPFTNAVCPSCGATHRVKRAFGPYTLERRHAVGGMSMVFVAHDATLNREVALKILSDAYSADERRIAAFEEEARITASFSHPNVVRVFKTGRAFGRFFIAMELVPGGHYEQRIHEVGHIPELEVLPVAIEVAQGLKAAHSAGLIHRDVKPGNILLDAAGRAKLVDFGLALVTQGGTATATELWATPYYVPPETVDGQAEDFRSDIYAFGATFYHALSGKPSCDEKSMATDKLGEAKKSVIPLREVAPFVSESTCRIIERAMAYNPAGRYKSYDELISDLTQALSDLKSGKVVSTHEPRSGRGKKRRALLAIAAGCAVVVVAGVVWFSMKKPVVEPVVEISRPEPVVTIPPTDGADLVIEITQNYREGSAAMEAGDFELAEKRFRELYANPRVQEPTRSWAGMQALLAALLDARPRDANSQTKLIREHLLGLAETHPLAGDDWDALLGKMGGLWPVPSTEASASAASVVANMLAALKNWDQGLLDEAAECFRAASSVSLPEGDAWAAVYQKQALLYLDDYQVLSGPLFEAEPSSAAECTTLIDRLDEALSVMKTRGRARFNTRCWQLDLKRQQKHFEAIATAEPVVEPEEPEISAEQVKAHFKQLAVDWRFADALQWLRDAPDDPSLPMRGSWIMVTEDAALFLSEIEKSLALEPFAEELLMSDGKMAKNVSINAEGEIRATLQNGELRSCALSDFSPDAMIAIHRMMVRKPQSEDERFRRHECAIAFDWLVGNRERARAAAAILSQANPAFKQRWETISKALPE